MTFHSYPITAELRSQYQNALAVFALVKPGGVLGEINEWHALACARYLLRQATLEVGS
ncbi:hypothetical protein [Nostoc sp. MG11]|uniref:hypothetical protein n=1 Tax=Nostoc sp. MG11 TaxID=2721166 RepID=UPI001866FB12|nr:hypothetical protein [Nostoc sp. MG11]